MKKKKLNHEFYVGFAIVTGTIALLSFQNAFTVQSQEIKIETEPPIIIEEAQSETESKIAETATTKTLDVPVLMYHYIRKVENKKDKLGIGLSVEPEIFEKQLQIIQKEGMTAITLDDMEKAWKGEETLPEKPIVLTFDDGYADFYTAAYPLLQKYNTKATVYVMPALTTQENYMNEDQIKEIDRSGLVTIGSHTLHHADMINISKDQRYEEITGSKKMLEELLGHEVKHFAYPYGHYSNRIMKEVEDTGYETAVTVEFGYNHLYKKRFMMTRVRVPGTISLEKFRMLLQHKS